MGRPGLKWGVSGLPEGLRAGRSFPLPHLRPTRLRGHTAPELAVRGCSSMFRGETRALFPMCQQSQRGCGALEELLGTKRPVRTLIPSYLSGPHPGGRVDRWDSDQIGARTTLPNAQGSGFCSRPGRRSLRLEPAVLVRPEENAVGLEKNRGARIRTGDLLLPKQARYRAAPRPVRRWKISSRARLL
jgi:hypothetical protein